MVRIWSAHIWVLTDERRPVRLRFGVVREAVASLRAATGLNLRCGDVRLR